MKDMSWYLKPCCFFFFFKQKTAYEITVRDWSSDVCSSDLTPERAVGTDAADRPLRRHAPGWRSQHSARHQAARRCVAHCRLPDSSGVHGAQVLGNCRSDDGRESGGAFLEKHRA